MSDNAKEIQIDESGFLTPGKAITISTMSLFIWILTGISYKALTFVAKCVNYEAVTFFASLLLSCICGFYLVKKILKNASFATKFILGFANILLLYTSANGIQTGYCFISKPASGEVKECSLIPFLVAKPWLPDQYTGSVIESLKAEIRNHEAQSPQNPDTSEIESLKEEINNLKAQTPQGPQTAEIKSLKEENQKLKEQISAIPDQSGYIKTIGDLTTKNLRLNQELAGIRTEDSIRCAQLINKNNSIANADAKATIARLQKIVEQYSKLNSTLVALQKLRQNPCISRGETAAFKMINELCGNDPTSANQFRSIIASLRPVQ